MGLTKKQVDRATYQGNGGSWDVRYDDEVPGFGVRIYPSGTKSFVVRYRNARGRTRLLTLGRYPVMTVKQARDRARAKLVEVADGEDPLEKRREARARSTTVQEVWDAYLEKHAKPNRKSWPEDERRYQKHVKPRFGSKAATDVSQAELRDLHRGIAEDAPVEANRVLELVRLMFNVAEGMDGLLPDDFQNPARLTYRHTAVGGDKIRLRKERSRTRWLDADEVGRLLEAVEKEENVYVRAAVKLCLYTGLRKSEVLSARWEHVNEERRELRVPERKSGEPLTVPLSPPAWEALRSVPRQKGSPWLFPSPRTDSHRKDIKRYWDRIRENAKLPDITVHDLRRTAGSWMAQAGVPLEHIREVLGQQSEEVVRVYARLGRDAPRAAVNAYAEKLEEARKGREADDG